LTSVLQVKGGNLYSSNDNKAGIVKTMKYIGRDVGSQTQQHG